jgi:hypothetical protein
MPGIMSDNDVKGYFRILMRLCTSEPWREVWQELRFDVFTLEDFGLPADATDAGIWQVCQREQIVLITANRNAEDPTSLEMTLRKYNNAASLPVLTLADAERIGRDRSYAEVVVEHLMEILIDLDAFRGAGRLYLL